MEVYKDLRGYWLRVESKSLEHQITRTVYHEIKQLQKENEELKYAISFLSPSPSLDSEMYAKLIKFKADILDELKNKTLQEGE